MCIRDRLNPKISNISCDKTAPNTTLDKTTDLIVLHFDFGDDPDDGHAAVAAKVYWIISQYRIFGSLPAQIRDGRITTLMLQIP